MKKLLGIIASVGLTTTTLTTSMTVVSCEQTLKELKLVDGVSKKDVLNEITRLIHYLGNKGQKFNFDIKDGVLTGDINYNNVNFLELGFDSKKLHTFFEKTKNLENKKGFSFLSFLASGSKGESVVNIQISYTDLSNPKNITTKKLGYYDVLLK